MTRGAEQQVSDFVRHDAPQQRAGVDAGRPSHRRDAIDVHGGQRAGGGCRVDIGVAKAVVARAV